MAPALPRWLCLSLPCYSFHLSALVPDEVRQECCVCEVRCMGMVIGGGDERYDSGGLVHEGPVPHLNTLPYVQKTACVCMHSRVCVRGKYQTQTPP